MTGLRWLLHLGILTIHCKMEATRGSLSVAMEEPLLDHEEPCLRKRFISVRNHIKV